MIIAISGKINSGKDTVGKIIQILTTSTHFTNKAVVDFLERPVLRSNWEIKKFADKLKDIVCILIGCTREQLEDREFKEKELGPEWWYYQDIEGKNTITAYNSQFVRDRKGWNWDNAKVIKLTPRLLMQLLGTEAGRRIVHPNIWINALMSEYNCVPADRAPNGWDCPNWIITDMRFPSELEAVKKRNCITIRVNRNIDLPEGEKLSYKEHVSETLLDECTDWDYVIENNGSLEELVDKVKEILIKQKII